MDAAIAVRMADARRTLGEAALRLEALSPLAVLGRGYAIARRSRDGAVLRSPSDATVGEAIELKLASGSLRAQVTEQ